MQHNNPGVFFLVVFGIAVGFIATAAAAPPASDKKRPTNAHELLGVKNHLELTNLNRFATKANEFYDAGSWTLLLAHSQAWIQAEPANAEAYYTLTVTNHRLGRPEEAIIASRQALRIKPEYGNAWLRLGLSYAMVRRYDEAETAYHEGIRLLQLTEAEAKQLLDGLSKLRKVKPDRNTRANNAANNAQSMRDACKIKKTGDLVKCSDAMARRLYQGLD